LQPAYAKAKKVEGKKSNFLMSESRFLKLRGPFFFFFFFF
jgi:hypothetical protein